MQDDDLAQARAEARSLALEEIAAWLEDGAWEALGGTDSEPPTSMYDRDGEVLRALAGLIRKRATPATPTIDQARADGYAQATEDAVTYLLRIANETIDRAAKEQGVARRHAEGAAMALTDEADRLGSGRHTDHARSRSSG